MSRLAGWSEFAVAVARSIIAGVVLALMFFAWRELVFPIPTVGGPWYCLTQTTRTDLSNYEGLFLGWRVVLAQSATGISGSSEKVWERGHGRLTGDRIDRGGVGGFLRYNYLATSRLSLHIDVAPRLARASTVFFDLRVLGDELLRGTFYWTSANQGGEVACQREPIDWSNEEIHEQLLTH